MEVVQVLRSQRGTTNSAWRVLEQLPRERNHNRLEGAGGDDVITEVKVTIFKTITPGLKLCQPKLIIHR